MDLKEFHEFFGEAEAERVAKDAGTNLAYYKQIMYLARQASPKLALRLERASNGRITRQSLRPDIFGIGAEAA